MLLCTWDNGFRNTKPTPDKEHPIDATRNHPDRIRIALDGTSLVANAGLLLAATLALHLGVPQLVQERLDLGDAPGPS